MVDIHERLCHGTWASELKRRYLDDPDMGCEEVLAEAAEHATVEQAEAVERELPAWKGPSKDELMGMRSRVP